MSKISSLKLLPYLRIAAELLAASIAGTAHVALDNVEYIYELGMSKKKEIMDTL